METKIHYALFELNGSTIFTIFYMDERFRCKKRYASDKTFIAHNGWKVASGGFPDIVPKMSTIFLRGTSHIRDKRIVIIPEDSHVKSSEIHEALQDWAKNWEGWEDSKEDLKTTHRTIEIYST
ncbi:MAG: hypothetical protein JRJ69_17650 [Deltaproteobacteria bacterium]|nr:hypothetical protein [Deltaproteobacteria bacterium]